MPYDGDYDADEFGGKPDVDAGPITGHLDPGAANRMMSSPTSPVWQPKVWSTGPRALISEDRAWLNRNMQLALLAGKRHSQPPCPPSWERPL